MIWRVYDKTDTLLEEFNSNEDFTNKDTIQLNDGSIHKIEFTGKFLISNDGYIYIN